jgi:hypothetical protein
MARPCSPFIPILWLSSHSSGASAWLQSLKASQQLRFLRGKVETPRPNPNQEDQGIPFCLDHHLIAFPAWETLPVATLSPA